jgi:glycosyltransferase involved in cell wall biosynthesis
MKVLFNNHTPFMLAHGGAQIQIEQTMAALGQEGVEVEALRWWDDRQSGDILHHFARIPTSLLRLARQKGMGVVFSDCLAAPGSRSTASRKLQKLLRITLSGLLPQSIVGVHNWQSYVEADACLALTPWERHLMADVFGAPPEKIHIVSKGVEEVFLNSRPAPRGPWLVCTATVTWRKRVLELAQAAAAAQTPLWVIGKPYSETDPYAQQFLALAKANAQTVRFEGPVQDRAKLAQIYREARGFVLLSSFESLSLSALEAAACQCPLLLSDLPWARMTFKDKGQYCSVNGSTSTTARALRSFYDAAPALPRPSKPRSWLEVARQLKIIYEKVRQG